MGKEKIFSVGQQYSVLDLTTAARIIFSGRCVLLSVLLGADGANEDCQVFDSRTGTGKEVLHLEALSGTSFQADFPGGVVMEQGIYVTVKDTGAHVSVNFAPLEKKSFRGE